MPERGLPIARARARAEDIRAVDYALELTIPGAPGDPVRGRVDIGFTLERPCDISLDIASPALRVHTLEVDGVAQPWACVGDQLLLARHCSAPGRHAVRIEFATEGAGLHRGPDHLYSLFVPDRARSVFPCFDQPDIKARLALTLDVPSEWEVVGNAAISSDMSSGDRRRVIFESTPPLPTYLFAFAAGRFECARGTGRRIGRVLHRASDRTAVAREADTLCRLHDEAIAWMEDYTGVAHPFDTLDVVLLPDFPFGGMEHPGAIFYNAGSQLLESTATPERHLGRARTIAHEVAHLWFGDLVTMRWFDDVWMKEVCAELMAAKIVEREGAGRHDDLHFVLHHHPQAYDVDRTDGANPIRQPLDNLQEAGQLYGPIIYMKAPIVFRQLELACGDDAFRAVLRRYLEIHAFSNASWPDLLALFRDHVRMDVTRWSADWIESAGRPTCEVVVRCRDGRITQAEVVTTDPAGLGRTWPQRLNVTFGRDTDTRVVPVDVAANRVPVPLVEGDRAPAFILPDGSGLGYGLFLLDTPSRTWLLDHITTIEPALTRGVAWLTLWDNMLEQRVAPTSLFRTLLRGLVAETDAHLLQRLLAWTVRLVWRFVSRDERRRIAPALERTLREGLETASTARMRATWFAACRDVCTTDDGLDWLTRVWEGTVVVPGLALSEEDRVSLVIQLALRDHPAAESLVSRQLGRTSNPDVRARLSFLAPAAASDPEVRRRAFDRLLDPAHRGREPWVVDALTCLNHPLRQDDARRFIQPGLACLPEIHRTGDIFLPRRWTEALLSGHNTAAAADIVRTHLEASEDLPQRLRWIVLAASDELFRAAH